MKMEMVKGSCMCFWNDMAIFQLVLRNDCNNANVSEGERRITKLNCIFRCQLGLKRKLYCVVDVIGIEKLYTTDGETSRK